MISSTYDPTVKAGYITVERTEERVGTLEVKGDIRYRKPAKVVPLKSLILLDFNDEQDLVGVELLGSIPQEISSRRRAFSKARIMLTPAPGSSLEAMEREATSMFYALEGRHIEPEILFTHNDTVYRCYGSDCHPIKVEEKEDAPIY